MMWPFGRTPADYNDKAVRALQNQIDGINRELGRIGAERAQEHAEIRKLADDVRAALAKHRAAIVGMEDKFKEAAAAFSAIEQRLVAIETFGQMELAGEELKKNTRLSKFNGMNLG